MNRLGSTALAIMRFIADTELGYATNGAIAEGLKKSPSAVAQHAKKLEDRWKFITRRKVGLVVEYLLTEAGAVYLKALGRDIQPTKPTNPPPAKPKPRNIHETNKIKRVHAIGVIAPFKTRLTEQELREACAPWLEREVVPTKSRRRHRLELVLWLADRRYKVSQRAALAYSLEQDAPKSEPVGRPYAAAINDGLAALERLEANLSARNGWIKLRKRRTLANDAWEYDYHLTNAEIAYTNDEVAKAQGGKKKKLLIRHPGTNKVCTEVDASIKKRLGGGFFELEFKGAETALPHAQQWDQFIDAYEHKGWNPLYERQARQELQDAVVRLAHENEVMAKNQIIHLPLLEKTNKILDMIISGKLVFTKEQRRKLQAERKGQAKL